MRALLIEPLCLSRFTSDPKNIFNRVQRQKHTLPLGITYVGAAMAQEGWDVHLLDLNVTEKDEPSLRAHVADLKPDIIGISHNFTANASRVVKLITFMKQSFPSTNLVVGGNHATFCAEEAVTAGADAVALFEAEETMSEVAQALAAGGALANVAGLALAAGGEFVLTGPRKPPADLNRLAFPLLEPLRIADYTGELYPIISGRGCNYSCYYCSSPGFAKAGRVRSVDNVMEEVGRAKRLGFRSLGFADDNLVYDRERFLALCQRLAPLDLPWEFNAYASELDQEMISAAKAAHCTGFRIGVESGSPAVLAKIKRGSSLESFEAVLGWGLEAGMQVVCGFMVPHYCDTLDTIAETQAFIKKVAGRGAITNVTLTTPFPGSRLLRHPDALGVRIESTSWDDYDLRTPTFSTEALSIDQIRQAFSQMEDMFLANAAEMALKTAERMGLDTSLVRGFDFVSLIKSLTR